MPMLKTSNADEQEIVVRKNRQFELECKAKLDEAIKRVDKEDQNLYKAYAFLWEKCSRAMQNKIVGRNDFDRKSYNNPIKLLIAIKEHALNLKRIVI